MRRAWSTRARAFTLIEILVAIAVVAVLLSLALPALASARRHAQTTLCVSTMRSLGQSSALYSVDHGDLLPSVLGRDADAAEFTSGETSWAMLHPLVVIDMWGAALEPYIDGADRDNRVWRCAAMPRWYSEWISRWDATGHGLNSTPYGSAQMSYYYSAALASEPMLWTPRFPRTVQAMRQFSRPVGTWEVAFPSAKVMLAERRDFHGKGAWCYDDAPGKLAVVMVDGSCRRVNKADCAPALEVEFIDEYSGFNTKGPVPFCASEGGFLGRDVATR
jgi:prepilin-type N-terminal cleavage/methylation domain-containing protein